MHLYIRLKFEMMKRYLKFEMMKRYFSAIVLISLACACSVESDYKGDSFMGSPYMGSPESSGDDKGSGDNSSAGVLTAGEWNDLRNWQFWGNLLNEQEFSVYTDYWGFYTNNRVAVNLSDADGNPAVGSKVKIFCGDEEVWSAVSDNHGDVSLWAGLFNNSEFEEGSLKISIDGNMQETAPEITGLGGSVKTNNYVVKSNNPEKLSDIAFIVDATGSMLDEIAFLQKDLMSVLDAAQKQVNTKLRTAAVFYRDKGDDYIVRTSDFSNDYSTTHSFIKKQEANGGGDWPEAVHTALETTLQNLKWNSSAYTKVAFLILDAPAHQDHDGVLDSLHKSIKQFAENGIRLIPLLASGADKGTEMMCRFFAISTGGTYTFLTDDSGVSSGEHVIPSVGEYQVEKLNEMMLRLIVEYTE